MSARSDAVMLAALVCSVAFRGYCQTADSLAGVTSNPIAVIPAYTPLSQQGRQELYLRSLVDPIAVVRSAAGAGIGQWRDKPEGWGQGGAAYAKRLVSGYGGMWFTRRWRSESPALCMRTTGTSLRSARPRAAD
jgi:hypothetical protein